MKANHHSKAMRHCVIYKISLWADGILTPGLANSLELDAETSPHREGKARNMKIQSASYRATESDIW